MSGPVTLQRSSIATELDAPRGSWWQTPESPFVVSVKCPQCGRGMVLPHTIAVDGTVTPSVVCPHEHCTWHEHVRLGGWSAFG